MRVLPLLSSFAAVLVVASASTARAQTIVPNDGRVVPQISVSGAGESRATPDRALVTVGVQSRAATAAAAAAENARKQTAILDTLRKLGYRPEQLSTAGYNVNPEMQYDQQGQRPRVIGYVVSNTVRVEVRQIDQAGRVIDAALAKGANEVHGLNFYLADPGPARRSAIADAVAKARADAEALATAAGGRLGQILELSTSPSGPIMFQAKAVMSMRGAEADASTPIVAGEETVRASVQVRWAFVAG